MCCTTRTTEEILGSGLSLFVKCCPTSEKATVTDMAGLPEFVVPGSKITTYIVQYFSEYQYIQWDHLEEM